VSFTKMLPYLNKAEGLSWDKEREHGKPKGF